jgi:Tfp pilus assembly protein PilF
VALAQKDAGQLTAAKASIGKAIDNDPSNWRLYVVSASIENALGHPAAAQANLRHARELSPRSTVLASVR